MLAVGAEVFVFTEVFFVVVFGIRDDKRPPNQPVDSPREVGSIHFVKREHFISEEGSLRGKLREWKKGAHWICGLGLRWLERFEPTKPPNPSFRK